MDHRQQAGCRQGRRRPAGRRGLLAASVASASAVAVAAAALAGLGWTTPGRGAREAFCSGGGLRPAATWGPRPQGPHRGSAALCAEAAGAGDAEVEGALAGGPRRRALGGAVAAAAALAGLAAPAWAAKEAKDFVASDVGLLQGTPRAPSRIPVKDNDPERLKEALYLISRVQEATVQQERLVSTGKFKDTQRNNIKMALNMMLDNYRLGDQIVTASGFLRTDKVMAASAIGNEAIDAIETAKEYFSQKLTVSGVSDVQRTFILTAMKTTRDKLDIFLSYMPEDVVRAARQRVEDENADNMKEYVSEDGSGMLNVVSVPWKK